MSNRALVRWEDLAGQRVGVYGLGVEGRASVAKLRAIGATPVICDVSSAGETYASCEVFAPDAQLSQFVGLEVVIKSPGISRYRDDVRLLQARGTAVVGGLGLFVASTDPARVVAITGTKGKSTTSAVLAHLASRVGQRVLLGGNIGTPPYDPSAGDFDLCVLEVSSFQATDLSVTPPLVGVTALLEDHLDWHGDVEHYVADKLSMCSQRGADVAVVADTAILRARSDMLGPHPVFVSPTSLDVLLATALGLEGVHNHANVAVARNLLLRLGHKIAATHEVVALAEGFEPLASRFTTVGTFDGVRYIDDSLASNVLATVAALGSLDGERVALICGGHERDVDVTPLGRAIAERSGATFVATLPASGERMADAIAAASGGAIQIVNCPDLRTAVAQCQDWAAGSGVVLLSPAAPSFGQFRDYKARSEAFIDLVRGA